MERSQERDGGEGVAGREPDGAGLRLRREIGLWSAVSLIAGCMIGSGIFMSPQGVLVYVGSPGASLVVWAVCGLLAMMGALCYAELGALVPKSGGEYAYILQIFGSLPAFLVIYTFVLLVRPAAIAAVSLSFAEYAVAPFYPGCSSMPQAVLKAVAAICILLLTLVNCWSSRLATMLMNAGRIGMAFYQGLWSFDGWNNVNYVLEELKNPKQNLVWALMIAIPLVTSLYLLVNISYLLVLSPNELLSSDAMAVSWGNQVLGDWAWLVPLAVTLSTLGSTNGTFFGGSRVCYVAAREGHMPQLLSMVHVHRLTPTPALMFTAAVALVLVIPGNFSTIVNFLSFLGWITYGTTISCLLYLRMKKKNLPRPYKVPTVIPVIMLLASLYLVLAPIIDHPQIEFLYIFLFLLSGIPVYFLLVHFQCQPKWLQMATMYLQLLLEVAPAIKNVD
ncbi:b(0,+)-type amino acid transporter 1-like isoform X3 [Canis lupus baileyi]|uniref:b(0,+)-type amino acid transporter 1-like isoform X3 n=1 Tax=Canis lupus familiaris TaxID=9615 RepID=UPI000BA9FF2D|nr:b(0,+)-type amino acid transporter 1-like isoform X3 [Canis lupus familiaris]XP_025310346.1 b(0,+)-type amino acid transporter 1-like isoform X3 [Canis lupus dingo]XP_038546731.1 b(0,+)-type amino acid transporter 1-like isoform X3 [Canis lupus familiaris]|eukprot:XP_022260192.1 b(0,+)-type amino acid transporter 1-like isoform X2 [Canis lupus familiaris]